MKKHFDQARKDMAQANENMAMIDVDSSIQEINAKGIQTKSGTKLMFYPDKRKLIDHLLESKDDFMGNLQKKYDERCKYLESVEDKLKQLKQDIDKVHTPQQLHYLLLTAIQAGKAHEEEKGKLRDAVDALKGKKSEDVRVLDEINDKNCQQKVQSAMEKKWDEKCAALDDFVRYIQSIKRMITNCVIGRHIQRRQRETAHQGR